MKKNFPLVILIMILSVPGIALAHSGGTNSSGCHTNHKTGDYHCHNKKPVAKPAPKPLPAQKTKSVVKPVSKIKAPLFVDKNCADFRTRKEAQAFYIKNGGPLRDPHGLDRDKDGKACEELR